MTTANSFYERPVLNSLYRQGRRPSRFIMPVPASRKRAAETQASLDLGTYTENALINEIRGWVDSWRTLPNSTYRSPARRFIDTEYNDESFFVRHAYFLGADDPYKSLKTALQAAMTRMPGQPCTPTPPAPSNGLRVAGLPKVINYFGDKVIKIFKYRETERRLLYVACTRAREHLLLSGVTPTSEYLGDVGQ